MSEAEADQEWTATRWFSQASHRVVSTGPLACPLARSLAPLNRLLAPHCSLRTACFALLAPHCLLRTACFALLASHSACLLCSACFILLAAYCLLCTACSALLAPHCLLCSSAPLRSFDCTLGHSITPELMPHGLLSMK